MFVSRVANLLTSDGLIDDLGYHQISRDGNRFSNPNSNFMFRNQHFITLSLVLFVTLWSLSAFFSSTVVLNNLPPKSEERLEYLNPPLLLDLRTLSLDAPLDYLPSQTLTAILPLLPINLGDMRDMLAPFFNPRVRSLREVIVICPQSTLAEVRRELQAMFSSPSLGSVDFHVSLQPWHAHADVQKAVLWCAAEVTTDWVLVMDENGLNRATDLERSALLNPPNVTLPLGPNGLTLNDYVSLPSQWGFLQPAQFLLPPFIMPSSIPRAFGLDIKSGNIWYNLGSYVSEHRADTIGGLRLQTSGSDAMQLNQLIPLHPPLDSIDWHISSSEDFFNDSFIRSSLGSHLDVRTNDFIFFLQDLSDLERVSALVCRLLTSESRPSIRLLIYESSYPSPNLLGWKSGVFKANTCTIDYEILTGKQQPIQLSTASILALTDWLLRQHSSCVQIVFTLKELDPLLSFLTFQQQGIFAKATIISIPRTDLEYTDWISSLTIAELKSKYMRDLKLSS